jgi:hypothetical protein
MDKDMRTFRVGDSVPGLSRDGHAAADGLC